jgi:hypothetical protein
MLHMPVSTVHLAGSIRRPTRVVTYSVHSRRVLARVIHCKGSFARTVNPAGSITQSAGLSRALAVHAFSQYWAVTTGPNTYWNHGRVVAVDAPRYSVHDICTARRKNRNCLVRPALPTRSLARSLAVHAFSQYTILAPLHIAITGVLLRLALLNTVLSTQCTASWKNRNGLVCRDAQPVMRPALLDIRRTAEAQPAGRAEIASSGRRCRDARPVMRPPHLSSPSEMGRERRVSIGARFTEACEQWSAVYVRHTRVASGCVPGARATSMSDHLRIRMREPVTNRRSRACVRQLQVRAP